MTYTLDVSGHTGQGGTVKVLWAANTPGNGLFIQNLSGSKLDILVTPLLVNGVPPVNPIVMRLSEESDWADAAKIDPTAAVSVRCAAEGASFTAFRTQS